MWPRYLDLNDEECAGILRRLELEAYSSVVSVFRAQGELTKERRKVLQDLCNVLKVPVERHKAEVRRAVNDELLNTVAASVCGTQSENEWAREGRRIIPLMRRANPVTSLTAAANLAKARAEAANRLAPPPLKTKTRPLKRSSKAGATSHPDDMENMVTTTTTTATMPSSGSFGRPADEESGSPSRVVVVVQAPTVSMPTPPESYRAYRDYFGGEVAVLPSGTVIRIRTATAAAAVEEDKKAGSGDGSNTNREAAAAGNVDNKNGSGKALSSKKAKGGNKSSGSKRKAAVDPLDALDQKYGKLPKVAAFDVFRPTFYHPPPPPPPAQPSQSGATPAPMASVFYQHVASSAPAKFFQQQQQQQPAQSGGMSGSAKTAAGLEGGHHLAAAQQLIEGTSSINIRGGSSGVTPKPKRGGCGGGGGGGRRPRGSQTGTSSKKKSQTTSLQDQVLRLGGGGGADQQPRPIVTSPPSSTTPSAFAASQLVAAAGVGAGGQQQFLLPQDAAAAIFTSDGGVAAIVAPQQPNNPKQQRPLTAAELPKVVVVSSATAAAPPSRMFQAMPAASSAAAVAVKSQPNIVRQRNNHQQQPPESSSKVNGSVAASKPAKPISVVPMAPSQTLKLVVPPNGGAAASSGSGGVGGSARILPKPGNQAVVNVTSSTISGVAGGGQPVATCCAGAIPAQPGSIYMVPASPGGGHHHHHLLRLATKGQQASGSSAAAAVAVSSAAAGTAAPRIMTLSTSSMIRPPALLAAATTTTTLTAAGGPAVVGSSSAAANLQPRLLGPAQPLSTAALPQGAASLTAGPLQAFGTGPHHHRLATLTAGGASKPSFIVLQRGAAVSGAAGVMTSSSPAGIIVPSIATSTTVVTSAAMATGGAQVQLKQPKNGAELKVIHQKVLPSSSGSTTVPIAPAGTKPGLKPAQQQLVLLAKPVVTSTSSSASNLPPNTPRPRGSSSQDKVIVLDMCKDVVVQQQPPVKVEGSNVLEDILHATGILTDEDDSKVTVYDDQEAFGDVVPHGMPSTSELPQMSTDPDDAWASVTVVNPDEAGPVVDCLSMAPVHQTDPPGNLEARPGSMHKERLYGNHKEDSRPEGLTEAAASTTEALAISGSSYVACQVLDDPGAAMNEEVVVGSTLVDDDEGLKAGTAAEDGMEADIVVPIDEVGDEVVCESSPLMAECEPCPVVIRLSSRKGDTRPSGAS